MERQSRVSATRWHWHTVVEYTSTVQYGATSLHTVSDEYIYCAAYVEDTVERNTLSSTRFAGVLFVPPQSQTSYSGDSAASHGIAHFSSKVKSCLQD